MFQYFLRKQRGDVLDNKHFENIMSVELTLSYFCSRMQSAKIQNLLRVNSHGEEVMATAIERANLLKKSSEFDTIRS